MKRISFWILPFLLAITTLLGFQSKDSQDSFNGGFELLSSQKGEPSGWYATRLPQTNAFTHFEVDSLIKHQGKYSVSIAIDPNHPQDEIAYNWTRVYEDFTVGKEYTISGWMKTEDLKSPGFIVIQSWDEKQDMIGFATTQADFPIKGTSDWTYAEKDFTIPEGTKELRVRVGIATPINRGGKVWFDDIKIH